MIERAKTRQIKVGDVKIGAFAPVSIQSMTKCDTSDVKAVVAETKRLEDAGCDIVRVAVKDINDARAVKDIKKKVRIPVVCDIHFNYRLALESIKNGADKVRLNPGNMRNKEEVTEVVKAAKKRGIPIRVGLNSGSIFARLPSRTTYHDVDLSSALVGSALAYIKIFEELDFRDIIISLKASDVATTVEAYRKMARLSYYPLHLGVTASGSYDSGIVKSSVGIGALLLDGIGDTIRVSLTADPVEEVIAAKRILSSVGLRRFGPEIISCPTCGRCQVNLGEIVKQLEREVARSPGRQVARSMKIAVMGCEVNGPGEAKEADLGIAFGKGSGMIFKKGKIIKKVAVENAVKELLKRL
ncbi:MAG: flavodoxin-dependent (E)-4-hydroxy-3-methylbut-2-enyl-diphosphate synthase [Candidatus Omnitrophica bacterium]|nr:flavodoxin-dependent (E)-4-hydroxy-3-methylbut-2-enyl-diphosphate synthase [Candidatus Omnitrophota bacterium]MDD5437175.1 flavodoxin-dependent (E)-4-hydroxy-3-methylbut-2-enyl-diphosphate synthase [Candidatus Omnitrophota bacterium]